MNVTKLFIGIVLTAICGQNAVAQDCLPPDSLVQHGDSIAHSSTTTRCKPIVEKPWFQATYLGIPLVAGSLFVMDNDKQFRRLRHDFLPEFKNSTDNYTQYIPSLVMLGMKAAGVKSRSSWQRMLVSDAIAIGLMTGVTQTIKNTAKVMRPDGTTANSFPSGHTATAFMTATMLHKEYGHLSPWISIGAYTLATGTGLMRIANNRHWLSDVMAGAGIGLMSTEFAYLITDLIYKNKGLQVRNNNQIFDVENHNPSFIGTYMGFTYALNNFQLSDNMSIKTTTGTSAGIEGAYFFTPHIGAGGMFVASNNRIIINQTQGLDNTIHVYSLYAGPYFSLPLSTRFALSSKLLAGYMRYPKTQILDTTLLAHGGWCWTTGLKINYKLQQHFNVALFTDYKLLQPRLKTIGKNVHIITPGIQLAVAL